MRRILWALPILVIPTAAAYAEMMLTSYYRAKAPHIAAHRTLPIGTQLIITNPRNGRSASVVIGTRGPFTRGRHLDISREFAKHLDFEKSGVLWLETRVVGTDTHADAPSRGSERLTPTIEQLHKRRVGCGCIARTPFASGAGRPI